MERTDTNSINGPQYNNQQQQQQTFTQQEFQMFHAAFQHHHQLSNISGSQNYLHSNPNNPNYSWQGVMEFLNKQEMRANEREQKLIEDKKSLEERVKKLEEELSKQVIVNKDLVKKMRVIEYQTLQQKKRVKTSTHYHQNSTQLSGMGTIGAGSASGGTNGSGTVGPLLGFNPSFMKRPRHQRGNSDGIQNLASRLFTGNHTRGSSGSNGQSKTFEENMEAAAILSQTLEQIQENVKDSRTMAQNFQNNFPSHHKTNSSDTQETIENQQMTKVYKPLETAASKQYLLPSTSINSTIPQKRRQISNGSQISQQLQVNHDQQIQTKQQASNNQAVSPNNNQVTITTTTTITQSTAHNNAEIGQRRKWLVQESVIAQDQTMVEQHVKINESNPNITTMGRSSTSQQNRSKAAQLSQVIQMQERFSKIEKSGNPLNTSSNSAISGGKKSHYIKKALFSSKCNLKSHLDSIRGIHFLTGQNSLVSASEDSTLKVWDVKKFCTLKDLEDVNNFEPYITLRGHISPIISLSGNESSQQNYLDNIIISGSHNGVLKAWSIPEVSHIDQYGPNQELSYCISTWENAHGQQPIWDIRQHPKESIFLSVGSDCTVGLWQIPFQNSSISCIEDNSLESQQSTLLGRFKKSQYLGQNGYLMPTSCSWINSDSSSFAVSFVDPFISIYDASTGKEKGLIKFQFDQTKSHASQQINKVIVSESQKLLIAGTEDNLIRLFDLNSNKQVKTMVAHTDAVTSMQVHKKSTHQMFISGGHDGSVRAWDLRTFQCIFDIIAHRRKYDEGVLSLASSENFPLIASGGADSLIKIMHEQ